VGLTWADLKERLSSLATYIFQPLHSRSETPDGDHCSTTYDKCRNTRADLN
jgi:hypothetical protein